MTITTIAGFMVSHPSEDVERPIDSRSSLVLDPIVWFWIDHEHLSTLAVVPAHSSLTWAIRPPGRDRSISRRPYARSRETQENRYLAVDQHRAAQPLPGE